MYVYVCVCFYVFGSGQKSIPKVDEKTIANRPLERQEPTLHRGGVLDLQAGRTKKSKQKRVSLVALLHHNSRLRKAKAFHALSVTL